MDDSMEKKHPLNDLMRETMAKIREMVDTNTIVGQPITTPDGVTLIPISKVSFGFGSGGGDYGKTTPKENFGGGSAAGVKIDPVAFLVIKDGTTGCCRWRCPRCPPWTALWRWFPIFWIKRKNISTRNRKIPPAERGILPSLCL